MVSQTKAGKAADNARFAKLQKELAHLRQELKKAQQRLRQAPETGPARSPLAPKNGFPTLPVIDGVEFAAAAAGVKYNDRPDVMLARIAVNSTIAAVFTRSATRSAPVLDCQEKLAAFAVNGGGTGGFAILVNSGNANAFTGAAGVTAVKRVTSSVAEALEIPESHVFSASTGVIGEPLPAERIVSAIGDLCAGLAPDQADLSARAILTTDTFAKGAFKEVTIDGRIVRIAGFAKGSGMIAPDMATMLVFLFTDAMVGRALLQSTLSRLNRNTFNSITVDSDTSTSDSVMLVATGRSEVPIGVATSKSGRAFSVALAELMRDLAQQVVRDGEGATKFIEVAITGAASDRDAHKAAMAIANSPLVKTAVAGEDPNWGRVVMAVGKSGARADRDLLTIRFGDVLVAKNGQVAPDYLEADGAAVMKQDTLIIGVDLGVGMGRATVWTCDLTRQYIAINADYRS